MQRRHPAPTVPMGHTSAQATLAQRLVSLPLERGIDAIPMLREALQHPDPWIRVHAVEGLTELDHPDAHAALTVALHDCDLGVQWTAARSLAAAGRAGVLAALRALLHDQPSSVFLHGVDSVLHHARLTADEHEALAPVRAALHHPAADLEAPLAAFVALGRLSVSSAPTPQPSEPWYGGWRQRRRARRPEAALLWPAGSV